MGDGGNIVIRGARVNNLKNVDIEIPRDKLVVITGLSGSGKSSLAFDTLYAEGQRRYVESISAYARQFLGRISKPETDYIKGIPPAIAIERKVNTRNPRSTVGTSTEVYDYLCMLFARVGKTLSPVSGREVRKHNVSDVVGELRRFPEGVRVALFTRVIARHGRTVEEQLGVFLHEGFTRVELDGETVYIEEFLGAGKRVAAGSELLLLIDRLFVSHDDRTVSRLSDSVETAFFEGDGYAVLKFYTDGGVVVRDFSGVFEADGIVFEEPSDLMFNFNSPAGACPTCEGLGHVIGISEDIVVPNRLLSFYDDAVLCWKSEMMGRWKNDFILKASAYAFPIYRPYYQLSDDEKDLLWHGRGNVKGIDDFFRFVESNLNKTQYRSLYARYRGKTVCPECNGTRLRKDAGYVWVGGVRLADLVDMPLERLAHFFYDLKLEGNDALIAERLLAEIRSRLGFLNRTGLGYLTLNRPSATLSGGESQRINIASSLGSTLMGSLYILDEPSIGLHSRDTAKLIEILHNLRDAGNSVVVVEHDEEIIRSADWLIDIGPEAGVRGGEVVFQGELKDVVKTFGKQNGLNDGVPCGYTAAYLSGVEKIDVPRRRRVWNNYINIEGACAHNLKKVDVRFPLNVMTVVTGVSGSGKSSLVGDVLYPSVVRSLDGVKFPAVGATGISGDLHLLKAVRFVDQNPAGKSSRSNPATYTGAFDEIRNLFSVQPLAIQLGFHPAFFSFNVEGGRCEECKGDGFVTVDMQFMADMRIECEVCHGKRFSGDILEVLYRGKTIFDVLEMTVSEAVVFFGGVNGIFERKILPRLTCLEKVGLGYLCLGQSCATLSGGENQRMKLALYLMEERSEPTLFIFDEPTTGLHFHDIKTLLRAFDALLLDGHTVIIIEHNLDVIKCADHVIDLGPEGGEAGGFVVCAGVPEVIAGCPASYTGRVLADRLY
ncbi:MAG: excinuclease ABC subunit UvrA [Dysgonamonadaceae bacterium]|nr:excinuclease ABC subunit UvrA [Dysgonamonadaceae bacterium]